jgi:hypothetical protein
MDYYLVLGATNSVLDYANLYVDELAAAESALKFAGDTELPAARSVINTDIAGVNRRALYLPLAVDEDKIRAGVFIVVCSVPYLHRTTRARVFYDEQEAKNEVRSFNAAVSRASCHAYLFTFFTD